MSNRDKAKKVYEWYQDVYDDTQDWREQRDRCKKAYFGDQWDSAVADRIRNRGQVDVVMNILRPLIRNRVSTMAARKPTGKIYGMHKQDTEFAEILDSFLDWHWYNSDAQRRTERVCMSQQREGVGYFIVALDPKADYGRGELKIYDEIYRHVFVPKTAGREWDYSDSPYIIVTKLITEDQFYKSNPGYKGKLTPDYFQQNDEIYWTGQREHEEQIDLDLPQTTEEQIFIREFDTYERFFKEVPVIYYAPTGNVEIVDDNYIPNNNENELIKQGLIKFTKAPVPRIKYTKTYGEKIFRYEEVLPIEWYPVVPVADEDTGNCMPLGEIDQTFGVQELANKAWSIVLLDAAGAATNKMIVDAARAGIKDLDKFIEEWAPPNAVVNMNMNPQTGDFPYKIESAKGINQAFYTVFERLVQHIHFETTTYPSKLGDTSSAPETYLATLQYGEWQQENLRMPLTNLEMAIQRVFNIILQWSPHHYDFPKFFDVIGEENEDDKTIGINQPTQTQQGWKKLNDITNMQARYRIRLGSTMPSQSMAYLNLYKDLVALNPVFQKYMVEHLPIKHKSKLIKEIDLVQQLSGKLKESEENLQTMSGMLQNELRQKAEYEMKGDAEALMRRLKDIEAQQKIILREMKSEQKIQKQRNSIKKETKK